MLEFLIMEPGDEGIHFIVGEIAQEGQKNLIMLSSSAKTQIQSTYVKLYINLVLHEKATKKSLPH